MTEPDPLPASPARPSRRRWGRLFAGVLLVAGLVGCAVLYLRGRADREVREAVAEADRLDPGWRLADLEAKRARPPDESNAAVQLQAARRLMPTTTWWSNSPQYAKLFRGLTPELQLDDQQLAALKAELDKVPKARNEARKLADMPEGYFDVNWSADAVSTPLMGGYHDVRDVIWLLRDDARVRAQEQDADGAVRSLQAAFNAGRAVGEMPTLLGQLIRTSLLTTAVMELERVLAQGEPSPDALKKLQHLLEEEDRFPDVLVVGRAERAGSYQQLTWIESSTANAAKYLAQAAGGPGLRNRRWVLYLPGEWKREFAAHLRWLNQFVEAAKLPEPQRKRRLDEIEAAAARERGPAAWMVQYLSRYVAGLREEHARVRCALVLLAAERYRREHQRWPESVQKLVAAGYLKEVPTAPDESTPIRLKRTDDGLVVYFVGPDGVDRGGKVVMGTSPRPGTELGFRLWDPEKRRRPPLAPSGEPPSPKK